MTHALWPEWATFKCPFCDESHRVRLARDALNGPVDDDGNQTPDPVDFAYCLKGDTDLPSVVGLHADRRVLKETAPASMAFEDTGSYWA
ncbi:hypothetical protein GCM10009425_39980 [Pseudomonas asuensis]|uniref:Uncharacterized protein n=1 Tax=Pseudomonas asuensis TaxID=1825787 RepID=A0ABQ2H2L2_9PSED|nr:hypothetical protein [Pseudomonas asuensis]GGM25152.1 hypothetical protein GCM10009425_39980 [Pseudomonas asuensis]